jgi:hypothetical protein
MRAIEKTPDYQMPDLMRSILRSEKQKQESSTG